MSDINYRNMRLAPVPMLVVNPLPKQILMFRTERQQIKIIIGAAVQNAAAAIDGGVDESIRGAAVLGLHVKDRLPHLYIRVMPEEHLRSTSPAARSSWHCHRQPQDFSRAI